MRITQLTHTTKGTKSFSKMELSWTTLVVIMVGLVTGVRGRMTDYRPYGGLNVRVEFPQYVKAGETAVLKCKYDLGSDPLYALKWYKGNQEFYRYTPKEMPPTKSFPIVGLQIDLSQSDANQLTLKKVDLNMTAKYSCEVTVDFPEFTTEVRTAVLYVVAFPEHRPEIVIGKRPLAVGDILDANCTSYRSKPAANLTWLINGDLANPSYLTSPQENRREWNSRETSSLGLRFILTPSHFIQGRLTLGCIAKIHNMYHHSSETTILEDDRPKISSVVDNSSSASNNGNNRYKSSGSTHNHFSVAYFLSTKSLKMFSSVLIHSYVIFIIHFSHLIAL